MTLLDPQNSLLSTRVGVLLMSFGTAETLSEVPTYLASVRRGRPVTEEVVSEFQRRFQRIGGSPLIRITRRQAACLEEHLNAPSPAGNRYEVGIGMRHSPPFIGDGLADLRSIGAQRILGIILSPQYSPTVMAGYGEAVAAAQESLGLPEGVRVAGPWHRVPALLDAFAQRVREALERLPRGERGKAPIIFTAHSLPRAVADGEPGYLQQLRETAEAVAHRARLAPNRWLFAYQSGGHDQQEWLRPDLLDLLPDLRQGGHRCVLVAPIQFVADHLEVLYDVDVAARGQAAALGLALSRTESLNTMPLFIQALAEVVHRELVGQFA